MTNPDRLNGALPWLLKIHWISSALCLLGMLLFSVTGITLNHPTAVEARPQITRTVLALPEAVAVELSVAREQHPLEVLPTSAVNWLQAAFKVNVADAKAEWSVDEIYLPLPKPGGDAWVRIDLAAGEAEYELTDRGWVSWANDLHKGRHTGEAWSLFIDVLAIGCLLFSLTGLLILKAHALRRPLTWPMVGLGALIPFLLMLLFIH